MTKSIKSYEDVLAIIWTQFINVNKHVKFIATHGWCQHIGMLPKSIFNVDTKVRLYKSLAFWIKFLGISIFNYLFIFHYYLDNTEFLKYQSDDYKRTK